MNILVTGGAGFIGSHVVDKYVELGHNVEVIDDMSRGKEGNKRDEAVYHELDIRSNEISSIFDKGKFDVMNHHAAQMDIRKSVDDPSGDADINIVGSLNLLRNCVRTDVRQVIFASTGGAIYGEQSEYPAPEDHETNPVSPYGVAKLSLEKYLFYFHVEYGLNFNILRYSNVYGPRQNPHGEAGVIAIFALKLLKNEDVVINGDGKQTRDYTYVDDIVRLNAKVLGADDNSTVNAGRGIEIDVNELYEILSQNIDSTKHATHGPAVSGEQRRSSINSDRAKKLYGWKAEIDIEEGIVKTVDFFKRHVNNGGKAR